MSTISGINLPHGSAIVPGAAAATDIKVPGIDPAASVIAVRHITADLATNADVASEVTVPDTDTIQIDTTNTTGDFVFVAWLDPE